MNKKHVLGGSIALLAAAVMTGCNSNDDNGSGRGNSGGGAPAATSTTLTVTPSLGRIQNARIFLRNAVTNAQIGTPHDLVNGSATFPNVPLNIPVIAEVAPLAAGGPITYFDEGTSALQTIAGADLTNFNLRAAIPNVTAGTTALGITAFTEAAVRRAQSLGALNPTVIANANATITTQLQQQGLIPAGTSFDILTAPRLVGAAGDLNGLPNTAAGQYAGLLAIAANAVHNRVGGLRPAIDFVNSLANDFLDGNINGAGGDVNIPVNLADSQFDAVFNQAAQQLRANLPNLTGLLNGITFSGGGSTNGVFGDVTIDGDIHHATSAAVVTVNNVKTITWSDGIGVLTLMLNATSNAPISLSLSNSNGAGFLACANSACSGIGVNTQTKHVTFNNIMVPAVNQGGQSLSVTNGNLSTDIATQVTGGLNVQVGGAVTSQDIAGLAGTYNGTGVLTTTTGQTPGTPTFPACSSTITNAGQISLTGGGFSITATPNQFSVVANTTVVVNGQPTQFRSVVLVEVGAAAVGTATVVVDGTGHIYSISGTRTTINVQNPQASTTTLLACSIN